MIKTKFSYTNGKLTEISVKGHANYAVVGRDIVCAAVSTATLITANAIEHLKLDHKIDLMVGQGDFRLTQIKDDNTVLALMKNLEFSLLDLQKQYPKYMKNQKEG